MRLTVVCIAIVALGTAACSSGTGTGSSGSETGTSTGSTGSGTGTSSGSTGSGTGSTGSGTGSSGSGTTVSFASDILPVFQNNCGIAGIGCHGTGVTGANQGRPFLGNYMAATTASSVLSGIVGVASYEDPQLKIVEAGNAMNSWLVIKLLGTQDNFMAGCMTGKNAYGTGGPCGSQMPGAGTGTMLDTPTINLIESWINQGAMSN